MEAGKKRLRVLHLSGDFPDPILAEKTPVIRRLVELTQNEFDHFVVSINRTSPTLANAFISSIASKDPIKRMEPFEHGLAVEYLAPPKGIFHRSYLLRLADSLVQRAIMQFTPDIIVGHKLTIEGVMAHRLSHRLGVPYAIALQGDTDTKILSVRRDLVSHFRRVYHEAAMVFPFSHWTHQSVSRQLGARGTGITILPCATDFDSPQAPSTPGSGFLSVFHLRNYRRKNLRGLISAIRLMESEGNAPRVDIAGGGTTEQVQACERLIATSRSVSLVGPLDRAELRNRLNRATGFILPSLRESFGLVFVEALFAGTPIIYPKGQAVDGYFDGKSFAIAVNPRSPEQIAAALRWLIEHEREAKEELREWQVSPAAFAFTREAIGASFASGLREAAALQALGEFS